MNERVSPLVESMSLPIRHDLFIGGQWRPASAGRTFDVHNPANGDSFAKVADAAPSDGIAAIDSAAAAAESWRATSPRARSEILRRAFTLLSERNDVFAQLIALENGKALSDARSEIAYAAEFFRWNSEEAVRPRGEMYMAPSGRNRILVQYQPIGICVLVTPWNFPAAMITRKVAPALAAGCTCVLKPAAETPFTALALADLLAEAGVPAGVLNVVTTSTPAALINPMLHDLRVRKLSFTGSTQVGRLLLREAADQVISCSMELGGNAPFIVFDDADLEVALRGAMVAKMRNGGQACTAANRFFVQRGVAERFSHMLTDRMRAMVVGSGLDPRSEVGPLISAKGRDKVASLVDDAVARGAQVLAGAGEVAIPGYFYMPTVLMNVPDDASISKEEIFGPVAAISVFEDEDEVVRRANSSEYGLISYVFTADSARGLRISERLESGMVGLNLGLVSDPAAPFGGVKQSGLGREGGAHGLSEYLEAKYIAMPN
ncbi:MAG: NAD-dependent succinate-semialdehyde dehydrogenase [Parvibaculaceae bacterium]